MKYLSVLRNRSLIPIVGIAVLALLPLGIYLTGGTAKAQCGTSTSSCKNCHEVQAQDPVSNNGEWHTAHAFGDFCEFCHAGTVEAKTQDEAHAGLVDPMVDVQASCQSCHPQDYKDKALVYATALGIQLGDGGGGATGGSSGAAGGGAGDATSASGSTGGAAATDSSAAAGAGDTAAGAGDAAAAATNNSAAAASDIGAAPSGELVDYNQLYAESTAPEETLSAGDWILIALIALLLLALLLALWKFEHWGDRLLRWWQQNMLPQNAVAYQGAGAAALVPMPGRGEMAAAPPRQQALPTAAVAAVAAIAPAELEELYRRRPELRQVTPYLLSADDKTLQALALLFQQPGARDAIVRLSKIDLSLVSALQDLSPADQALLLALAQKR